MGIPYIHRLRYHPRLHNLSKVWPYETGFVAAPVPAMRPFMLHVEIWPGVVNNAVAALMNANRHLIRDQAQVQAMCQWASNLDTRNELATHFTAPQLLTDEQIRICIEHEGWILGAPLNHAIP